MIIDKKVVQNKILTQGQLTKYIVGKFKRFYKKYKHLLTPDVHNRLLCIFIYAVMIFEDYNRGPIIRKFERIKLFFGRRATVGIMQMSTDKNISDEESVVEAYNWLEGEYEGDMFIEDLAWEYNNDTDYVNSVMYIYEKLYEYIDEIPILRKEFCLREEPENSSFREKVKKLKVMYEEGLITEEDFMNEKNELLLDIKG